MAAIFPFFGNYIHIIGEGFITDCKLISYLALQELYKTFYKVFVLKPKYILYYCKWMTSIFYDKHKESISAAELLKNSHYSSTVNRAYYGCIQYLLDILFTRLKVKPEDFYNQRVQNREGTHGWASKLIEIELAHVDRVEFKWYQKTFPEFQKLREKADYEDKAISQSESVGSISTANSIINCVNQNIKKK
jgi:uncharacterized protein (UPF0332 family)